MGRQRKRRTDSNLPPYVRRHKSRDRVIYQPYEAGQWGRCITLRDAEGAPLLADATSDRIWRAYAALDPERAPRTLRWLTDRYLASPRFQDLAPRTQAAYRDYAETILETPGRQGKLFGDVRLSALRRRHFISYLERRPRVAGNCEIQFLRSVYSWGIEREYVKDSPAHGFRLNPKPPRTRYITDREYERLLEAARAGRAAYLAPAMELAYLLRARVSEVLSLQREDLGDDGIHLRRAKGSESEITLWSPRLQAAVAEAKAVNRAVISPYLLHTTRGRQFTYTAVRQAFTRARERAGILDVTFHDLKAKGITDHAQHHGGHRSARMREVYVRLPDAVDPTR